MAVDDNSVRFKHFKTSSSGKCVLGVVAPLPGKLFNFRGYLMPPAHLPTCIYVCVCILYILVSHTSTLTEFWAKWASVKSIFLPRRARSMETQRQDNGSYRYTPHGCQGWGCCGSAPSTLFVECVFLLLCLIQLNSWLLELDWCPIRIHFSEHKNEDGCWGLRAEETGALRTWVQFVLS